MSPPRKTRAREESAGEVEVVDSEARKRRDGAGVYVTKCDAQTTEQFVKAIRGGATIETASSYAGVEKRTMRRWMKLGRQALEDGDDSEELAPFVWFVRQLDEALGNFKLALTTGILAKGQREDGQWQALAWLGERRFPDEFGKRSRVDLGNADGTPFALTATPSIDPSKLSDAELDQLIELYEKAKPAGAQGISRPELRDVVLESGLGS